MNIGVSSKLNINPEDSPETILRLFVYGTLKRGYWNHQRFCNQARSIESVVIWGKLYHLHAGFLALKVPEGLILPRRGTAADPLIDAYRQQEIGTLCFGRSTGDWDLIYGELVTFTDPQRDLPSIDRLEGFRPGGHSMYQRYGFTPCMRLRTETGSSTTIRPFFGKVGTNRHKTLGFGNPTM